MRARYDYWSVIRLINDFVEANEVYAEVINNENYLRRCRDTGLIPEIYWVVSRRRNRSRFRTSNLRNSGLRFRYSVTILVGLIIVYEVNGKSGVELRFPFRSPDCAGYPTHQRCFTTPG